MSFRISVPEDLLYEFVEPIAAIFCCKCHSKISFETIGLALVGVDPRVIFSCETCTGTNVDKRSAVNQQQFEELMNATHEYMRQMVHPMCLHYRAREQ